MRATIMRLAGLGTAFLVLLCGQAHGQTSESYSPPAFQLPLPFGSTNVDGGLYTAAEFVGFRQTNPLHSQVIAYQGFVNVDGTADGGQRPGTFDGSGAPALTAKQASGPMSYQPGTLIEIGWRFADGGGTLSLNWMYLTEMKNDAAVSLSSPFLQLGNQLQNSFLFSPVYNFPFQYSGLPNKLSNGDGFAAFGIWNAASLMGIEYTQNVQQWDIDYRVPFYETENTRTTGIIGGRFTWLQDDFKWTTVDVDVNGNSSPLDSAVYSNLTSNRMYGPHVGIEEEWYLGHGFAVNLMGDVAAFVDIVKERVKYEFADRFAAPQSKYSRTDYCPVGEADASLGLTWYIYEFIELKASYNLMAFMNTIASENPVAFDWGAPIPQYNHVSRFFDGLTVGIAFQW